ncbi:MAG: hypothetical protein ACOYJY_06080 [Acutalibacteraceae bacterium]|jgi:hypothetical protein
MNRSTDRQVRRYIRQIRRELVGSRAEKKRYLDDFKNNVAEYRYRLPLADATYIRARFGEPKAIAASYLASLDPDDLRRRVEHVKKRRIGWLVAAAAVLLSIFFAIIFAVKWAGSHAAGYDITITYSDGYTEEEVTHFYES